MSVINRMLSELDARRASPAAAAGAGPAIAPVPPRTTGSARRLQLIVLLGAVAISAAAFGNWPGLVGAPPSGAPRPALAAAPSEVAPATPAASAVEATVASVPGSTASSPAVSSSELPIVGPGLKMPNTQVASLTASATRTEGLSAAVLPTPAPERIRPPEIGLPLTGAVEKKLVAMTPAQRAALAYRQATEFAASGHSSQSIDKALEALKVDPDHLAARQLAAVLLFEKNRYEEASVVLREGLLRKPQQPQLAYLLARLQVESGDLAGALAVLAQADGLSADGHGLRAGILAQLGRYGEALKAYEAAVRLDPDNASWWLGLGVALDAEGQTAHAKQAFQRARAIGSLRGDLLAYIDQKLAN